MLRIGNYGRKSIYSDKSDSTEAQYKMSLEYCKTHYTDFEMYRYEDEGYTGANVDRPDYTRLINDVLDGKLDIVICYKIDRISRNVLDFSNFFNLLSEHNVEFISIKEQIDTSTPLGRAMMYICSVFAQMERETIVERVKDNMIELAKSGKWAGGQAPIGLKPERINNGGKSHVILMDDPDKIPFLNMVADTFLEGYSLGGLETHFRNNNIKSPNGKYLSSTQIYNILKNPHYAPADSATLEYFKSLGCTIGCSEDKFDGTHAIIAYGRTTGGKKKKHSLNPPEKWIISVGLHKPIMSSEKWLMIQQQFGNNIFNKTRKHHIGLLKGVLKCSCGHTMRVHHKVDKTYNKTYDYYFCQNRNRRGIEYCSMGSVQVSTIDNSILDMLKAIRLDKSLIDHYSYKDKILKIVHRSKKAIENDIKQANIQISNLTAALASNPDSAAAKYIIPEIESIDKKIIGYKYELMEIDNEDRRHKQSETDKEVKYKLICYIVDNLESLSYDEINQLLNQLLKECTYDGTGLKIKI